MHRIRTVLFLLLIFFPALLFSQEFDEDPQGEDDWDVYEMDLYLKGDQTFIISAGTIFPAVFFNDGQKIDHNLRSAGVTGSLAYNYHISPNIFIGGEFGFIAINTIRKNSLYFFPINLRAGYQFNVWKLEIPLSAALGVSMHRYLNERYFGLYLKGGGSIYYRFTTEWSFGVNTMWCWFPEWTDDPKKNVYGNFVELTLCARYHF